MIKYALAALFILFVPLAWADSAPGIFGGSDDSSADAASEDGDGKMKTTGGFVNMEPQTDYDAPEPERSPAGDDDGDKDDKPDTDD